MRRMRDCIGVYIEIVKLIKFSPKYENMLEDMKMHEMIIAESYKDLNKDYDEALLKINKNFFNKIDHMACRVY